MVKKVDNTPSSTFHILVAEDSRSARSGIVSSLASINATIHEADDGLSAFEMIRGNPSSMDLILSDLVMKTMHGDELCHKIRHELAIKDLPFIILSSQTDKRTIIKLFEAGVNDYLFKPFTPEELVARIRAHLDQRRLHKLLSANVEELSRLNQMKDHFLAACSHDFRSPLQGILGFAELLITDDSLEPYHIEILKNIMEAGNQLHGLIESLLDVTIASNKPGDIPMIPMDLNALISSCVANISINARGKNITVEFDHVSELPFITGNPNALSRVFHNLMSNAVKFTPEGGKVQIGVKYDGGDAVTVNVQDNGLGISEKDIHTIFDRYSKASRKGTSGEKSTGLGLYITRQLVDLHKGGIRVDSRPGKGSCFSVTIPINNISDSSQ